MKSSNSVDKTLKLELTSNNDSRLLTYINKNIKKTEKIVNKTDIILNTVGDSYKYKLYTVKNI